MFLLRACDRSVSLHEYMADGAARVTEASDFVRTLRTAEKLESQDEIGSSLAWYLKARKIYPASDFAQEGISRLVKRVLPES